MENLRNKTDVNLVNNEEDYSKWTWKPSNDWQWFENDLVWIRKSKLSKPAYVGMCTSGLSKVLMYEVHHDYIKNKYGKKSRYHSRTLIV